MTCREAERLVMPYINGSITDEELKAFVEHIDHCPDCREELEIYFTVDVGIRQLDDESGTYNIKGALETALDVSRQRIHTLNLLQNAIYAVNTLLVCVYDIYHAGTYLEPDWILTINKEKDLCDYEQ